MPVKQGGICQGEGTDVTHINVEMLLTPTAKINPEESMGLCSTEYPAASRVDQDNPAIHEDGDPIGDQINQMAVPLFALPDPDKK